MWHKKKKPINQTCNNKRLPLKSTVYIYVDPDIGYVLDDLDVYYGYRNQYSVNVKFVRTGVYSFIMPGNNVYITATFRYESLPFTDVNRSQWFYDEVYYVYTNGMMEGDSATTFNPDGTMTRAMFWAVLGRIDGATITGTNWADGTSILPIYLSRSTTLYGKRLIKVELFCNEITAFSKAFL